MKNIFYAVVDELVLRYIAQNIIGNQDSSISTEELLKKAGVIAFSDSNEELWGEKRFGLEILPPHMLLETDFDKIFICASMSFPIIQENLTKMGVPIEKIDCSTVNFISKTRIRFLYNTANMQKERNLKGAVAEGGVFRGYFAKEINLAYPKSKLYLFDTFEGFPEKDIITDVKVNSKHKHMANTSVDIVMEKMKYPENVEIHKGYFPESAEGIDDKFVFVNLDFDLYSPIKAGLEFFFPKMVSGGIILVHDYYNTTYSCKKAVDEFCADNNLYPISIGDVYSVAIIKA